MRKQHSGAYTKCDPKVHLVWTPKYGKPVLAGLVAIRAYDLLRQIAPVTDGLEERERFPTEIIRKLSELKLMGSCSDEVYSGAATELPTLMGEDTAPTSESSSDRLSDHVVLGLYNYHIQGAEI